MNNNDNNIYYIYTKSFTSFYLKIMPFNVSLHSEMEA